MGAGVESRGRACPHARIVAQCPPCAREDTRAHAALVPCFTLNAALITRLPHARIVAQCPPCAREDTRAHAALVPYFTVKATVVTTLPRAYTDTLYGPGVIAGMPLSPW